MAILYCKIIGYSGIRLWQFFLVQTVSQNRKGRLFWWEIVGNPEKSIEMRLRLSLIIDEEESGEEAQEGEPGQHRHGVRRQGVQSRQDAVHFEGWRRLHHLKLTQIFCFGL